MYTAVKGIYENGEIKLLEPAPKVDKSDILVTFLNESAKGSTQREPGGLLKLPHLKGKKLSLPLDFNHTV